MQHGFTPIRSDTDSTSSSNASSNTEVSGTSQSLSTASGGGSPNCIIQKDELVPQDTPYLPFFSEPTDSVYLDSEYIPEDATFYPKSAVLHEVAPQLAEGIEEPYFKEETSDGWRYFCRVPNCDNKNAFTRHSDLKRHQKEQHSVNIPKYHCGCCKNMGILPVYCTHRKDRMTQHRNKKHSGLGFEICNLAPCNNNSIELVFSSRSCLLLHQRDAHGLGGNGRSELNSKLGEAAMSQADSRGCLHIHKPLIPSKRIKCNADGNATKLDGPLEVTMKYSQGKPDTGNHVQRDSPAVLGPRSGNLAGIGKWSENQEKDFAASFDIDIQHFFPNSEPFSNDEVSPPVTYLYVDLDIENVPPADILISLNTFQSIESELKSSLEANSLAESTYISYNVFQQTVKVHGTKLGAERAKAAIEEHVRSTQKDAVSINQPMQKADKKTFTLRINEDRDLISAWENDILPALPDILQPLLGNDYSIFFVREGPSKNDSWPCVQIESPERLSKSSRKDIKKAITLLFRNNPNLPVPTINFYEGHTACLAYDDSSDEDDVDGSVPFRHEKRYWEELGMGGSVGLRGTRSVSATSGGYILVNGRPYLHLANHFVEKGLRRPDGHRRQPHDPIYLTSPSLRDVYDYRDRLNETLKKHAAITQQIFDRPYQDLKLEEIRAFVRAGGVDAIVNSHTREAIDEIFRSKWLLEELEGDDDDFLLGHIAFRCSSDDQTIYRNCTVPPGERGNNLMKMDWALCDVTSAFSHRQGTNRHRFPMSRNSRQLDYRQNHPGNLCEYTCPITPEEKVHYVGRVSGLRRGEISPTRGLVGRPGYQSSEWWIQPEHGMLNYADCAGDSGAWVITKNGNYLMAQLWGHSIGKLLITPIEEVFKDIKRVTGAETVELPDQYGNPHYGATPLAEICEVTDEEQPRNSFGFKFTTLPPCDKLLEKPPQKPRPRSLIKTIEGLTGQGPITRRPSLHITSQLPPTSPVPSLSSCTSSSPDRKTPSPSPQRSPSTPVQPGADSVMVSSPEPIILKAAETGLPPPFSQEPESLEEKFQNSYVQQQEEAATLSQKRKPTVQFMLHGKLPNEDTIRDVTNRVLAKSKSERILAHPRPIRPLSKSNTFPLFHDISDMPMPAPA